MLSPDVMRPLSRREREGLATFLAGIPTAMSFPEAHGCLTAAAIAPKHVPPSQWGQLVVGEHQFDTQADFERVFGLLVRLYNEAVTALTNGTRVVPTEPEEIEEWCDGFLRIANDDDEWMAAPDDVKVHLFPLAILARDFDLVGTQDDAGNVITDAAPFLERARNVVDDHVHEMNRHWTAVRHAQLAQERGAAVSTKVGRNEPCTCGSGKKFKKCCGAA